MISSIAALKDFFKHERRGAFTVIDNQQMHCMAGHHAEDDRYTHIYTILSQRAFRPLYHAFSLSKIHNRVAHINSLLFRQIETTVKHAGPTGELPVTFFTRHVVYQTMVTLFLGPEFPDIFPDGDLLDTHMATIMYGLEFMVPSAIQARERLYSTFAAHLASKWDENREGTLEGASDFMSEIIREMKLADLSPEEVARYMIPFMWGASSNLMAVCTWVMGHILQDDQVYRAMKDEILPVTDKLSLGDILNMDSRDSFPGLDSIIQEVLRTKTQIPLMRVAQEDVVLMDQDKAIYIRKGDLVAPDAPSLNMSSVHFDDPHSFKADRFNKTSNGGALYVFGAGQHVVRGIYFSTFRS